MLYILLHCYLFNGGGFNCCFLDILVVFSRCTYFDTLIVFYFISLILYFTDKTIIHNGTLPNSSTLLSNKVPLLTLM